MATEQNASFIRDLAASDRPTREKALESLRMYLTSGRKFTYLELLKIWKGIFYCVHHTANPLPQQRLSRSLAGLLLDIPKHVFIPFLAAFFQTMVSQWSSIPSLRLDKYLFLLRLYISHSFIYLSRLHWPKDLLQSCTALMTGQSDCQGILDPSDGKVGDGLRYHVLEVWVDGLVETESWEKGVENGIMTPLETIVTQGATKTLKAKARKAVDDERLERNDQTQGEALEDQGNPSEVDAAFEGFED